LEKPPVQNRTTHAFSRAPGAWSTDVPEYGNLSEIGSKNAVYVYSDDMVARKIIVGELRRYDGLQIAGRLEDADLVITYVGASHGTGLSRGLFGRITRDFKQVGELAFSSLGETANGDVRPRILWTPEMCKPFRAALQLPGILPQMPLVHE
jgi:hypothetical protein